jgi:hypothetical protein
MRTPRTTFLSALVALPMLGSAHSATAAEPLRFEKLNRTYSDFVPPLETVERAGVKVRLASPKQTLLLRDHRVRLAPQGGGLFAGDVELDVQGKGTLVADVEFGPLAERFTEEVIVPPQKISLAGKVRMRRVDGGYELQGVEVPKAVEVAIQSQTLNSILALCDRAAIVSLGAIDCTGLDRALTRPAIPLPSGQPFVLHDTDLTEADRSALDALLAP